MAAKISISLFLIALLLLGTDAMPHALGSQVAAAASASDSEVTMNVVNNETGNRGMTEEEKVVAQGPLSFFNPPRVPPP
ncbi:hypothetical protein PVAP13_5KG285200 [Panicum virgatum]|uniref:Uncharacterized protein n=1 Tax=Panicum virgatum TaxID=38727 RepID=A0A8T0SLB7_PANVG|nr:hypothetical protein PVAP13_5KG285200 [Panicum virgatum]